MKAFVIVFVITAVIVSIGSVIFFISDLKAERNKKKEHD